MPAHFISVYDIGYCHSELIRNTYVLYVYLTVRMNVEILHNFTKVFLIFEFAVV